MTSPRRVLPLVLTVLAFLLAPSLGSAPAQAQGTGTPVIVTPVDGAGYDSDDVPDLVVDFGNAPYGDYDWSVKNSESAQVEHSGTFAYDATDQDQQTLSALSDLGDGSYTATVSGTGGTVTASFEVFTVVIGPPPVQCQVEVRPVRAVAPTTAVYPTFHGCQGDTETWAIRHRVGAKTLTFGTFRVVNGRSTGPWRFKDTWPTGVYDVVSRTRYGYRTSTVVRFGSRISLHAGSKVDGHFQLSGDVTRYVPSADGFRGWASRPVAISYKNCAVGCPWRFLVVNRTDSTGHFSSTASSATARYWRATVASTSSVWGRTSDPVKR